MYFDDRDSCFPLSLDQADALVAELNQAHITLAMAEQYIIVWRRASAHGGNLISAYHPTQRMRLCTRHAKSLIALPNSYESRSQRSTPGQTGSSTTANHPRHACRATQPTHRRPHTPLRHRHRMTAVPDLPADGVGAVRIAGPHNEILLALVAGGTAALLRVRSTPTTLAVACIGLETPPGEPRHAEQGCLWCLRTATQVEGRAEMSEQRVAIVTGVLGGSVRRSPPAWPVPRRTWPPAIDAAGRLGTS